MRNFFVQLDGVESPQPNQAGNGICVFFFKFIFQLKTQMLRLAQSAQH